MSRKSQRYRSTTLPFRYRDRGIDFRIEQYSLDGRKPSDVDLLAGEYTVDLTPGRSSASSDPERQWDRALLFGTLEVPQQTINELFPESERDSPPAKLYVAVRCHETIYRDSIIVEDSPITAGEYPVQIPLDWDSFRGRVELRPYLTRTEGGDFDSSYASSANVKVASGQRYEIVIDRWDEDDPPAIDGEEVSFSENSHLPDGPELYYLDFRDESRPKLWINADFPRVVDVLRSEGSVGAEPRMRDVVLDQISYGVWLQLLFRAGAAIDRDGSVEYEWQRTVLEAFAPEVYGVDDVEDAKQLLRADLREPTRVAQLVGQFDTELQSYLEFREQLINLMEEGLRI